MQLNIFTGFASAAVACRRYCWKWSRCGGHFTSRAAVPCYSRARIQRGELLGDAPLSQSIILGNTDFADKMFCLRVSSSLPRKNYAGAPGFLCWWDLVEFGRDEDRKFRRRVGNHSAITFDSVDFFGLGALGVRFPVRARYFFSETSRLSNHLLIGYRGLFT
jgi:hypothetical protein